jgi:hypothetical protein
VISSLFTKWCSLLASIDYGKCNDVNLNLIALDKMVLTNSLSTSDSFL